MNGRALGRPECGRLRQPRCRIGVVPLSIKVTRHVHLMTAQRCAPAHQSAGKIYATEPPHHLRMAGLSVPEHGRTESRSFESRHAAVWRYRDFRDSISWCNLLFTLLAHPVTAAELIDTMAGRRQARSISAPLKRSPWRHHSYSPYFGANFRVVTILQRRQNTNLTRDPKGGDNE